MCGILSGMCEKSLQNRIEAEPCYQSIAKNNVFCATKLYNLVRKNCNGSTEVVVEDVISSLIEPLLNFALIRGDDHESLPKHLQAHKKKFEVPSGGGFVVTGANLRHLNMSKLISRGKENRFT